MRSMVAAPGTIDRIEPRQMQAGGREREGGKDKCTKEAVALQAKAEKAF